MSRERQKNQLELAFTPETRSEASTSDGRVELPTAEQGLESEGTTERLMEEICEPENMRKALKRVQGNKGAPGIDGITVEELPGYMKRNWPKHREELLEGTYKPKPARRKEIPKSDGGSGIYRFPVCWIDWFSRRCCRFCKGGGTRHSPSTAMDFVRGDRNIKR